YFVNKSRSSSGNRHIHASIELAEERIDEIRSCPKRRLIDYNHVARLHWYIGLFAITDCSQIRLLCTLRTVIIGPEDSGLTTEQFAAGCGHSTEQRHSRSDVECARGLDPALYCYLPGLSDDNEVPGPCWDFEILAITRPRDIDAQGIVSVSGMSHRSVGWLN